jgi:hypothetical protein
MTFDPKAHLIQLPRRVKDPATGQWTTRLDDYLEVKHRLVWFREKFPRGTIITETVLLDWDKGVCIHRAHVGDGEGGMATGTGTETRKSFEDFVEKSETRAIGRALAALGIGTQFVGEELSEGEHIADAPVAPPQSSATEPASDPAKERLSQEAVDHLWQVAKAVNEPKDAFARRMRQLMQLPGSQLISKTYLRQAMSIEQYRAAVAYYDGQLRAQVEDVPTHEPPPPAEEPPAVPLGAGSSSASASVPADDPEAEAKAKLGAEVAEWALPVPPEEVTYILEHYSLAKARALLWGARQQKPAATPIEAAASAAD